ncbi:PilZ domain-containing protein [Vulcanococcus limneticus Candia 3F8]|uniref:PilZ domain-containing protein n=1 Tax=Vulcanococcus limneticus TaxID=2170428 RepID=UPI000B993D95|nr:PilZ domain-containing protein [Vulcanococcus limneticus]MCP9790565.1 PilZ domain-containing protein [Vulcanococcus limneticus MW73D5]MCP9892644.1 PilZ domain-containing protein [Vulcanococcus limneticus Candia 3F8]MCP9896172.1 PilZ domain-containing protein [Vulcanococcus limneticus Candia 3B3]
MTSSAPLQPGQSDRAEREVMPSGTPINLHLPKAGSGIANLYDINDGGACAIRRGRLEVSVGDVVEIEVAEYDARMMEQAMDEGRRIQGVVRWCRLGQSNSRIGISFVGSETERRNFVAFTKMARAGLSD